MLELLLPIRQVEEVKGSSRCTWDNLCSPLGQNCLWGQGKILHLQFKGGKWILEVCLVIPYPPHVCNSFYFKSIVPWDISVPLFLVPSTLTVSCSFTGLKCLPLDLESFCGYLFWFHYSFTFLLLCLSLSVSFTALLLNELGKRAFVFSFPFFQFAYFVKRIDFAWCFPLLTPFSFRVVSTI